MNNTSLGYLISAVLILGLTLRLTRFFVTDSLGRVFIDALPDNRVGQFIREMTDCLYCTSFWAAVFAVGTHAAASQLSLSWLWYGMAAPFAISWVAAHLGDRLGDGPNIEEDPEYDEAEEPDREAG